MANSSAQIKSAPSASHATDETHEKIIVTVRPEGRSKTLITKTNVKILLALLLAVVLLTLVLAMVIPVSKLKKKNPNLEGMLHEHQTTQANSTEHELPQPPQTRALISTSPKTMPPETRVSTPSVAANHSTNAPSTQATTTPNKGLTSCAAIHMANPRAQNGTYTIYPGGHAPGRRVWCDMSTDGGGWTVFQRRINGSLDFNQTWNKYKHGFGLPESEMWLGNDDIHRLTTSQPSELRVDLFDWDGIHGYAKYFPFGVSNASTNYTLRLYNYRGTIGDSLTFQNSMQFSTKDRDNNKYVNQLCKTLGGGGGGWWYGYCDRVNLNGRYYQGGVSNWSGVIWNYWRSSNSTKATSMMTRPRK